MVEQSIPIHEVVVFNPFLLIKQRTVYILLYTAPAGYIDAVLFDVLAALASTSSASGLSLKRIGPESLQQYIRPLELTLGR